MSGRDLGTFYVRVEFEDGSGYYHKWSTGQRRTCGTEEVQPLTSTRLAPIWESVDDVLGSMLWMYTEGNYSCDCNKRLFLARAAQQDETDDACGNTLTLKRLTAIFPDGTERELL